jgi:hypothetical protein
MSMNVKNVGRSLKVDVRLLTERSLLCAPTVAVKHTL